MEPLRNLMEHCVAIYGRYSRLYVSHADRITALNLSVDALQDGIRKDISRDMLASTLSDIIIVTFLCVDAYRAPFVEALSAKYPRSGCAYCGHKPCDCKARRSAVQMYSPDASQLQWSFEEWCKHLVAVYGEGNKKKGIDKALLRLFGEVTELAALQLPLAQHTRSIAKLESDITLELSDIFCWAITVAHVLDLDIVTAFYNQYGVMCPGCEKEECECTPH